MSLYFFCFSLLGHTQDSATSGLLSQKLACQYCTPRLVCSLGIHNVKLCYKYSQGQVNRFMDYLLMFNWLQFQYLLRIFKHILCTLLLLWLSLEEVISETFWKLEAAQVQLGVSSYDVCLSHSPKGDTIYLVRSCTDKQAENREFASFRATITMNLLHCFQPFQNYDLGPLVKHCILVQIFLKFKLA